MRVPRGAVAVMVVAGLLGLAAGCGGDDDSAGETTTEAATTEAPATTQAPATTAAPDDGGGAAATSEEGEIFFASNCTGCHLENGTAAGGVGPQLSDSGLTEDEIVEQIENGGGAMPAGLATGQDLENVTAYVLSLQ